MIAHHAVLADSAFALVQVAIGLGIVWRPTLKVALAGSIVWALGVWWVGEGFGGIFNGTADPVTGAPGAVMVYALLAVLLWPREHADVDRSFPAAMAIGARRARALWLVLWGSLSYFAVAGANSSAQGLHDLAMSMASGEPGWLARFDRTTASVVAHQGLTASVVLAVLLATVAIGIYLPARASNATLVLAAALGIVLLGRGRELRGTVHEQRDRRELRAIACPFRGRLLATTPDPWSGARQRRPPRACASAIMNMSGPGWLADIFAACGAYRRPLQRGAAA